MRTRSVTTSTTATNPAARLTAIAALSGGWAVQPTHTVTGPSLRRDPPAVEPAGDQLRTARANRPPSSPPTTGGAPRRRSASSRPGSRSTVIVRLSRSLSMHRGRRSVRPTGRPSSGRRRRRGRCGRPAAAAPALLAGHGNRAGVAVPPADARRRRRGRRRRTRRRPCRPTRTGTASPSMVTRSSRHPVSNVRRHRAGGDVADLGDRRRHHHRVGEPAVARRSLGRSHVISIVSGPAAKPSGTVDRRHTVVVGWADEHVDRSVALGQPHGGDQRVVAGGAGAASAARPGRRARRGGRRRRPR